MGLKIVIAALVCVVTFATLTAQVQPAAPAEPPQAPAADATNGAGPRTVLDSVYTAAQAAKGAERFKTTCSMCHGPEMKGTDFVPELVGDSFVGRWENANLGDIVLKITATMPPDRSVMLTDAEAAEVVARILEANGYPAGQELLSSQAKVLAQIKVVKKKP